MARAVGKNALYTLTAGLSSFAMGLGTGIITARWLGPHDRGIFSLISVLPHTISSLVKLGMAQGSVYAIRRDHADPGAVAGHLLILAIAISIPVIGVVYVYKFQAASLLMGGANPLYFLLALPLIPLLLIESYFFGVLQAVDHFGIFNRRRLLAGAGGLIGIFLALVVWHGGLVSAIVVSVGITAALDLWLIATVARICGMHFRWNGKLAKELLSFGVKSHLQTVATHMHFRADLYLVAMLLNPTDVAFYSIASRLAEVILFVPESLGLVVYPKQAGSTKQVLEDLTASSCRHVTFMTVLLGVVLMLIGPWLVVSWYGHDYAPAGPPLLFVVPGVIMMSLFFMLSRSFTSQNRQEINIVASGVAVGCNVLLNLWLIPRMGISGAGLSTALSYTLATLILGRVFLQESGKSLRDLLVIRFDDLALYRRLLTDVLARKPRGAIGQAVLPGGRAR
ncbi:MAG: oligosaccharide flippase family protein [Deltaproteobacteria bacterium]|nr:oligosaccharide flippase family protein [Deltaproteobacteria bacterium]MBI3389747.1 oligosaccharide flippase family protein [Deltaproteobacteria bacterium]